jgi:phage N-6-adenine-methyltransferase
MMDNVNNYDQYRNNIIASEIHYWDEPLENGVLIPGEIINLFDNGGCQIIVQIKHEGDRQKVWALDINDAAAVEWLRRQSQDVVESIVIAVTLSRQSDMMLAINKALFSSATDLWATPQVTFNELNKEFGFETDVCALPENAKCENYFTPAMDGLAQPWTGKCWMNPPYGRTIGKWVEKAHQSSLQGATVVCLLPARTDTKWFHDYCIENAEIRFVKGRLKFGGSNNSAPFPSVIIVFRPPQ